ncbi:MAG: hypothetical protein VW962_05710, partial [Acidimicrobiaceae bacterium]
MKSIRVKLSVLLSSLLGGFLFLSAAPATAEVFDTITTQGDGWDVTFHPTNQNYAFFAHHRNNKLGCFYRIDPDGAGPLNQGDGCFNDGTSMYLDTFNGKVGRKSSVHVTSNGLTAYAPLNLFVELADYQGMGKFDISDPDPDNWTAKPSIAWPVDPDVNEPLVMQERSNSIIVDDVIYALSSSRLLMFDTATESSTDLAFANNAVPFDRSNVYEAAGKIWAMSSDWHLNCYDPGTGALCAHDDWVDGRSVDAAFSRTEAVEAMAEYRNTDGSFGGFCFALYASNAWFYNCLNAAGELDTTMVNPFEQHVLAMDSQADHLNNDSWLGQFQVSRQHQLITYTPFFATPDYYCWDYTTQAMCDNFITSSDNASAGRVYTVRQDPWNDNCFWSNAHDELIGVWEVEGHEFATQMCDVDPTTTTTTTTT